MQVLSGFVCCDGEPLFLRNWIKRLVAQVLRGAWISFQDYLPALLDQLTMEIETWPKTLISSKFLNRHNTLFSLAAFF